MEAYIKDVRYLFEVADEVIAITDFDESWVHVEEVRKNGQEDTHMSGELVRDGVNWDWNSGREMFAEYHSEELADAIAEYLNVHGLPKVD